MNIIKNDVENLLKSQKKNNVNNYLSKFTKRLISNENIELEISKINDLNNNTSNIYNIYDKNLNIDYICKIFDITKNDTNKELGDNEFYFYKNMINNIKNIIKIPIFYGFIKNENNEIYGLLLEKLNNINYMNIDCIKIIINDISKLHLFYWNNYFKNIICENSKYIIETRIKTEAKYYFYNISNIFEDKIYNMFNKLLYKKIEYINEDKNKTLIHGSLKIENIILVKENNEIIPCFIDWGLYKIGYGIEDILFLLIFTLNDDTFKNNIDNLLEYYFIKINESREYKYEDFIDNIKLSLIDFILHAIIGLFIKNHFSKIKNDKLNIYLNNYLYLIEKYNILNNINDTNIIELNI
jgi:hypothetical protein